MCWQVFIEHAFRQHAQRELIAHQFGRKRQCRVNIFLRQTRKLSQNGVIAIAGAQKFQNGLHCDTGASNGWASVANIWVDSDAFHGVKYTRKGVVLTLANASESRTARATAN